MDAAVPPGREEMIGHFWLDVRARLQETHGRSENESDLGIGRYRYDTERRGIGDAIYNQGAERTAEIVDGVIEHGLPNDMR